MGTSPPRKICCFASFPLLPAGTQQKQSFSILAVRFTCSNPETAINSQGLLVEDFARRRQLTGRLHRKNDESWKSISSMERSANDVMSTTGCFALYAAIVNVDNVLTVEMRKS